MDKEKLIKEFEEICGYTMRPHEFRVLNDVLVLLKEQEVRELTMDEWQEWKNNPKRNPICELWEHDTSPMWVLNPNDVHEPAFLMGKLKLFTGKPTFEQCKVVKWDERR